MVTVGIIQKKSQQRSEALAVNVMLFDWFLEKEKKQRECACGVVVVVCVCVCVF